MKGNTSKLLLDLKKLQRDLSNAERRSLRNALAAAYAASWHIAQAEYPTLQKNSHSGAIRPFKDRIERILSTKKSPMWGVLSAEVKAFSALNALDETSIQTQKGVKVRDRKHLVFTARRSLRKGSSLPFVVLTKKKQRLVMVRNSVFVRSQSFPSLWNILNSNARSLTEAAEDALQRALGKV